MNTAKIFTRIAEWKDESTNLPCKIIYNSMFGVFNGYVGLDKNHPFYGYDYCLDQRKLNVHGGITYSELEEDGLWWIGFDCAHAWDKIPNIPCFEENYDLFLNSEKTFRDTKYVRNELKKLCQQLRS